MTGANLDVEQLIARGRRVLATEAEAVAALEHRLGSEFAQACRLLLACTGRIVVTGMGKSGHVAGKIAATLASTGSPAFFLHPAEAIHGDIGMITAADVVLALSNSGETDERQPRFDARALRDGRARRERPGRSLLAESRANREHHRDAGDG